LAINSRNIKVLGLLGLPLVAVAVAVLLLASAGSDKDTAEAAAGPGMDLVCTDSVGFGVANAIVCQIESNQTPGTDLTGFGAEVLFPDNINPTAGGCTSQVKPRAEDSNPPEGDDDTNPDPLGNCTRGAVTNIDADPDVDAVRYVVVSDTDPNAGDPLVQVLVNPDGSAIPHNADGVDLVNFTATCKVPGNYTLTLTTTAMGFGAQTSSFGGFWALDDLSTIPTKLPNKEAVTCTEPPTATNAPALEKIVSAELSAAKVLQGGTVTVSGTANFQQDLDGDTVAGWGSGTISIASSAGAIKIGTLTANGNAVCVPVANGGTCTANVNKGPASPPTGPESTAFINFSNTVNCSAVGNHNVVVTATFTREDGTAVPPEKSTNNQVSLPLTCNPLTPPIQKSPALSNLFLTDQAGPKLPPTTCAVGDDTGILQEVVGFPITSLDPKGSGDVQVLSAFEFEVRFDNKLVCVNLVPGPEWDDAGVTCLVLDKDTSLLEGIARLACFSAKGAAPGNAGLHLADIVLRPHPELYSQIRANQENGIVAQILNQDCELADELGHPIAIFSCEDAEVTIRFLEGDVNADCVVDVLDGQALAFRWNALLGSLLYGTRYDLEPSLEPGGIQGDGDVDVKDIQFVFGRQGSTCENPNPPQPPENPKAQGS
jgi:hypothetical protein